MMTIVHFVFIGEGSSDEGLIPHLESLCIESGADEVTGIAPDFRRLGENVGATVEAKLRAALQLEPNANLFFLHRDTDNRDPQLRYTEISAAVAAACLSYPWVAVVPVQETEAWLLIDEAMIRKIARRPSGRLPLNLPRPSQVEARARPKELLQEALVQAAELSGRRLKEFRADFPTHRWLLLQSLPTGGRLEEVESWRRMRQDTGNAIHLITVALSELAESSGETRRQAQ